MPTFQPLLSEGVQLSQLYSESHGGIESGAAVATASSGTITTSGLKTSRISPTAAITAVVMQVGTTPGQECWIVNESANTVTMAASGTSNVAGGVNDVIAANQARLYVWDDQTTLWYATPQIATTTAFTQSATAVATASSGTITTAATNASRVNPAAAITAAIMQAGTIAGQLCMVVNEAAVANSVQFAASGTSNVANGVACIIPGLSAQLFEWDSGLGAGMWVPIMPSLVDGKPSDIVSATTPATATSGTIATAGVGTARATPTAAVTAVVLGSGTVAGQEVTVVNESTTGANSITFAASATSNVANGTSTVISGLTCSKFKWADSLWYHMV